MDELRRFAESVSALIHHGFYWGVLIFAVTVVVSLGAICLIVLGWPADRFLDGVRHPFLDGYPRFVRGAAIAAKNVAGVLLIVLGVILSLPGIPGQGILTIFIGLTLSDFPGKLGLERRFIGKPPVLRAVNRLRARFGHPPLLLR